MTQSHNLLKSDTTVVAIGAYDAFSALLVERAGFDAVYIGSYSTEASFGGKPDLAMMTKTERLMITRNVVKVVSIPVIADAEEGYGNAINVMDTVRDFEDAGVTGIHLDDEGLPSKCPFIPGAPPNHLISVDEMCGKIEAAVNARRDPDFLIIARSDVIGTVSRERYYSENLIKEVVHRSNAYAQAGANAIFVMALNEDELHYFRKNINSPLVGVFATAEPIPISAFRREGYALTIGSIVGIYAAAKGLTKALAELKRTEDWNEITHMMIDDEEFFNILGIENYRGWYKQFRIQ